MVVPGRYNGNGLRWNHSYIINSSYKIHDNVRVNFDAEVQSWIDEDILQAVPRDCYVESVVPLMAVV